MLSCYHVDLIYFMCCNLVNFVVFVPLHVFEWVYVEKILLGRWGKIVFQYCIGIPSKENDHWSRQISAKVHSFHHSK